MPPERTRPPRREPYYRESRNGSRQRVPGVYVRRDARGQRVFEIGFRDSDGRQRWQTVEGGVTAAERTLADRKARMGRGERVAPKPTLTFGDAAGEWLESQVAALRPATQRSYRSHLETHLLPRWRRRRLDSLDVDAVARVVEEMRAAGKKAWTIRGTLTVASRVFEFARRRQGWAGGNPVRDLDRRERPSSDQAERRVLTGAELDRLLVVAPERHRLLFAFAAGTGARQGEVLGLVWRALDLDAGTVAITHQLNRDGERVALKTKRSRRTVELPGSLVAGLRAHRLASPRSGPDDFVFVTRTGRPFDHRAVGRALATAVRDAGLDQGVEPAPTFHSLRHGFASRWIAAAGDLVELSAHLGHADPAITASVYAHEFERAQRSPARRARLDAMFGADLGSAVEAEDRSIRQPAPSGGPAKIVNMREVRDGRQ